jgi:hypothetical protein
MIVARTANGSTATNMSGSVGSGSGTKLDPLLSARQPGSFPCPCCNAAQQQSQSPNMVEGMQLFPMTVDLLDRSVAAKRKAFIAEAKLKKAHAKRLQANKKGNENQVGNGESDSVRDEMDTTEEDEGATFDEIQAESPYVLLFRSQASSSSVGGNNSSLPSTSSNEGYRTGRWTFEEIELVEFLLTSFDRGVLPLPMGVRLDDFLGSILLCKASRLTKKMKHARLSIREYDINPKEDPNNTRTLDCEMLSTLQEKFLHSIANEAAQLELRFSMEKAWRTNLFNLCVQVGCTMLNATAWIASMEAMERRAAVAEENIRKARRRRMGLALKVDVGAQDGVFFSEMPVQFPRAKPKAKKRLSDSLSQDGESMGDNRDGGENMSLNTTGGGSSVGSESNHISNMLDMGEAAGNVDSVDDFAVIFKELIGGTPSVTNRSSATVPNNSGSFLEQVLSYMEINHLPFEHVEIWVPCYPPQSEGGAENLRLYHAGHATRSELDPGIFCQLNEFGEYSTKFSFLPGVGLPGRVYKSGMPAWECNVDESDPKFFERAGGAKVYCVRTGVGIPISSNYIGRLVVVMFSVFDRDPQEELMEQLAADLVAFCPKPTWKLVVEMGPTQGQQPPQLQGTQYVNKEMVHYQHGMPPSSPRASLADVIAQPSTPRSMQAPSHISVATTITDVPHSPGNRIERRGSSWSAGSVVDSVSAEAQRDEEIQIATLLGDHMPGTEVPAIGEPASMVCFPNLLLPHFMSLRLMLLRSPERRTTEENALLEVIRKSHTGFCQDPNRSPKEIAELLARDWRFLQMTAHDEMKKPAALASAAASAMNPIPHQQRHGNLLSSNSSPDVVNRYIATSIPLGIPSSSGSSFNAEPSFSAHESRNHKERRLS